MSCTRCVMDDSGNSGIILDDEGVCQWCHNSKNIAKLDQDNPRLAAQTWVRAIIAMYRNRLKYDCIIGLSGGIDSSTCVKIAYECGLKPLLVYVDNGFGTEIATANITRLVEKTGFELLPVVLPSDEFRDVQLAFFKAGVLDLDIPSDHAIVAVLHQVAQEYGIRHIIEGGNYHTNAFMPSAWTMLNKNDATNLRNIHKQFGSHPLIQFPILGFYDLLKASRMQRVQRHYPLNLLGYDRRQIVQVLHDWCGFEGYRGVHGENILTRFYQRYILPQRFGIDKRKAHYSCLIHAGQMTREDAVDELNKPVYMPDEWRHDFHYIIRKLGITPHELGQYIIMPTHTHEEYGVESGTVQYKLVQAVRSNRVTRSIAKRVMGWL